MKYCVYGIRLKGDSEVRYVGFSRYYGEVRLRQHFYMAAREENSSAPFAVWLRENRANVEVFSIWEPDTCDAAVALEHGTIEMCTRLGHRLFNRSRVPTSLRIVEQDTAA